jgi:hypothetical protein
MRRVKRNELGHIAKTYRELTCELAKDSGIPLPIFDMRC